MKRLRPARRQRPARRTPKPAPSAGADPAALANPYGRYYTRPRSLEELRRERPDPKEK